MAMHDGFYILRNRARSGPGLRHRCRYTADVVVRDDRHLVATLNDVRSPSTSGVARAAASDELMGMFWISCRVSCGIAESARRDCRPGRHCSRERTSV